MTATKILTMKIFDCEVFVLCSLILIQHVTEVVTQLCTSEAPACGRNEVSIEERCVCQGFQDSESGICLINGVYSNNCTAGSTDECKVGLVCVSSVNKCLCPDGSHYDGTNCTSNDVLKPYLRITNVALYWTAPGAIGYQNTFEINYSEHGGRTWKSTVTSSPTRGIGINNLNPGTTYTATVVRSITREGRTQAVPVSGPLQFTTHGVYSDNCTAGSTDECKVGLVCVSSVNKCLCPDGSHYDGTNCTSNDVLKPYLRITNVALYWTAPGAIGYQNTFEINYSEHGGRTWKSTVTSSPTRGIGINNLNSGTTYTATVVRSITREGRTQAVPASEPLQFTTHGVYSDNCTAGSTDECKVGLVCVSSVNKCLCPDGSHYDGTNCTSNDVLKPYLRITNVALYWTAPGAIGYQNTFEINYSEHGGGTWKSTFTSSPTRGIGINNLNPGTTYTATVVRSITREGRTQAVPASEPLQFTTHGVYSDNCTAGSTAECKVGLVCVSSVNKCLCPDGSHYSGTNCTSNDVLKPYLRITNVALYWAVPDATGYNNTFLISYSEQGGPTWNGTITSSRTRGVEIGNLNPGTTYTATVVRSITRECRTQAVPASDPLQFTTKPAPTSGLTPATTLMEPVAQIHFYKAEGRADSYTVTLTGDGYNMMETISGPGDTLSQDFPGVVAGLYYNLTIITIRFNVSSDPFTKTIRVTAAFDPVVDLSVSDVTSRTASLSWKRPINTKGGLYKYGIEVFNMSTCVQRINIQCTECPKPMAEIKSSEPICESETDVVISQSNLNNVNFLVHYHVSLLPSTLYQVVVAAYNEEGKGMTDQEPVQTQQEAPGDPTDFRFVSKTSESVELTWTPPEPRPGVTEYLIRVYEWDESLNKYTSFMNTSNLGFYNVIINITGLSSYWIYRFELHAKTSQGVSNVVNIPEVTTDQSAPREVTNLVIKRKPGVYNQIELSWSCPNQKDGRNGVIKNATVIYLKQVTEDAAKLLPKQLVYEATPSCSWETIVDLTPGFNYTFEVYISNMFKGIASFKTLYLPEGPPNLSGSVRPIMQIVSGSETDRSVSILICPSCLLENTNGVITKSGILLCGKGNCPIGNTEVKNEDYYDNSPNWDTASGVSFMTWYRVTEDDWLQGKDAAEETKYVLGEENCGLQDQNSFCNGPLPVDPTYRVWIFACTEVACSEGDHLEFTLDDSLPGSIIAAIVVVAVLVVVATVLLVVYIKVIRPRSQRKRRTQYETDTSPKDDTYDEIAGGNRLGVIQDGRPDVDYYNTKDCPPRSENTYDQLTVYSNEGHHDYGRIKDTQT